MAAETPDDPQGHATRPGPDPAPVEPRPPAGPAAAEVGDVSRSAAERLAFFSDAVVAIAITLLAIDLPVPTGDTNAEFFASVREQSFAYLTFLISFLVISVYWMSHHRVFRYVARVDQQLVLLNLGWLVLIVLNPFLTEIIRDGEDLTIARFGTYAVAQALVIGTFALILARLERQGMYVEGTPAGLTHRGWVGALIPVAAFLVSVPLFPLLDEWAFAVWVVVPVVASRIAVALRWIPADR